MKKKLNNNFFRLLRHSAAMRLLIILGLITSVLLYVRRDYDRVSYLRLNIDDKDREVIDGYLVYNPKCHVVSKNSFDPSALKFIKKEKFKPCSSNSLLTSVLKEPNGDVYLTLNIREAQKYLQVECCWSNVFRPIGPYDKDDQEFDKRISTGPCVKFQREVKLDKDVETVFVKCMTKKIIKPQHGIYRRRLFQQSPVFKSWKIYRNVHAVINPKKIENLKVQSNVTSKKKLSVFILGLDSMSRLNFHRTMPLSSNYLDSRGYLEFRGYNKIGDNTFPNLMALLTGYNESWSLNKCDSSRAFGLDDCPFIWKAFRDAGYSTAWAEEAAYIGTFSYNEKVGFVNPPVDYYLRPYFLATESLLHRQSRWSYVYCSGPEVAFLRVINLAIDFVKTFLYRPYFGIFWTSSITHNSMSAATSIDYPFYRKLLELEKAGALETSMVLVMSDHGLRYTEFRHSELGWYEDRLPLLYIWLPQWFRDYYPEAYRALIDNRNKLISPFDLYETLRDILARAGGEALPSLGCLNCTSLFEEAPFVRGCSDAGIDSHWCACVKFKDLDVKDEVAVEGVNRFLEYVEDIVKSYIKSGKRLCAKLKLKKIHKVRQFRSNDKNIKNSELLYVLETNPGSAKFELTVGYDGSNNYTIRERDISRINSYHKRSECLDKGFKKYCDCVL